MCIIIYQTNFKNSTDNILETKLSKFKLQTI